MSRYVMVKRGVGYVMVKREVGYLIVNRGIGYLIDIQEIPIKKSYFLDYIWLSGRKISLVLNSAEKFIRRTISIAWKAP